MAERDDIEDVVSSIRRLVASEGGERPEGADAEAGRAPVLRLSPESRVSDAIPAAAEDPFQMIHRRAQQSGKREARGVDLPSLADLSERAGGEDALRDLIAEVVRAELSGELGERITRNVRKLVRREMRMIREDEED